MRYRIYRWSDDALTYVPVSSLTYVLEEVRLAMPALRRRFPQDWYTYRPV